MHLATHLLVWGLLVCFAGELIVTLDGDLQNDPKDIPRLLRCLVFGDPDPSSPGSASQGDSSSSVSAQSGNGALLRRMGPGYDMVCGWRKDRKDDFMSRNLPSAIANALIGQLTGVRQRVLHRAETCFEAGSYLIQAKPYSWR